MTEPIPTRPDYLKLKTFIKEFDNNAFVNVATVSEVSEEVIYKDNKVVKRIK